jgi:hypothetical protein
MLSALASPAMRREERALALLCRAMRPACAHLTREVALEPLWAMAGAGELRLDQTQRLLILDKVAKLSDWNDTQRLALLLCALPESRDRWVRELGQYVLLAPQASAHQRHILSLEPREVARELLSALYRRCEETQLRGLWAELDLSQHEAFLPVWASWMSRVSTATRHRLVEQLAGCGLLVAEPILRRVAWDAQEDPAVRRVAVRGLGALGTRLSMTTLLEAQGVRSLSAAAREARAAIEARYPVGIDRAGALEIVEGGVRGALSMCGADEDHIALYQEVAGALDGSQGRADDEGGPVLRNKRPELMRLSMPPRRVWHIRLAYLIVGDIAGLWVFKLLVIVTVAQLVKALVHGPQADVRSSVFMLLLFGCFGFIDGLMSQSDVTHLKRGHITTAKKISLNVRSLPKNNGYAYDYVFEYRDERGARHTLRHTEVDDSARDSLEDEDYEPILYTTDAQGAPKSAVLFDSLRLVYIAQDGSLRLRWWAALITIGYLLAILAAIVSAVSPKLPTL